MNTFIKLCLFQRVCFAIFGYNKKTFYFMTMKFHFIYLFTLFILYLFSRSLKNKNKYINKEMGITIFFFLSSLVHSSLIFLSFIYFYSAVYILFIYLFLLSFLFYVFFVAFYILNCLDVASHTSIKRDFNLQ